MEALDLSLTFPFQFSRKQCSSSLNNWYNYQTSKASSQSATVFSNSKHVVLVRVNQLPANSQPEMLQTVIDGAMCLYANVRLKLH